ncbi:AAA family ATPase [Chryseobacterium fluminis]|uniref:AAA family ATPase n=1 Tax=Chryseobacterium fluminis TaxID=2983606 RepID=UPI00225026CE|nr:AAA family ATPase [Chryseobacterium sp. MMS21-Ot14]UZT97384.1 AAA family ATPase [Chryseobacterium sp. MMS21-Ot14]
MQINKIIIKNLYGYIDKSIEFNDDLTLLVGINGSGKTSILNIINWVLKPSIENLCITQFDYIQLFFTFNNDDYEIKCQHDKIKFAYNIKRNKVKFHPLIVKIITPPSELNENESLRDSLITQYARLKPDSEEQETWELISTFPSPTVIGLDRNLYAEESEYLYYESSHESIANRKSISKYSPLDRVKDILNKEYRRKKNEILKLTNNLKNHLMLSSFEGSITLDSISVTSRNKLTINQIEKAEKRVNDYFINIEKSVLDNTAKKIISNFFTNLKEVIIKYDENSTDPTFKLLYNLNSSQFVKVNKLLKEFEQFDTESNKKLEKIINFIDTLNFFLKDSSKKILFKDDTAELCFHTLDRRGEILNPYRDLRFLSSGEQQLLILFSYIAFNSQDGKIFIIDEPELSLHIKWQEDFLDQLERITPSGIQLILATHSPILANKKRIKTKILLPYNE